MLLEEIPCIIPYLKALISGQKFWGGQSRSSSLRLWKAILKISNLLHKWGIVQLQSLVSVNGSWWKIVYLNNVCFVVQHSKKNWNDSTYSNGSWNENVLSVLVLWFKNWWRIQWSIKFQKVLGAKICLMSVFFVIQNEM